jgi:aspartyl protease family protein
MRPIITLALALLVAGVMLARLADRRVHDITPAQAMTAGTAPPEPANARSISLSRMANGHFGVEATVDGRRLDFIVDTGASYIALREIDAARLGIHPARSDYSVKVSTANGVARAALVQLGMVEVGNIVLRDLPALVQSDDELGVNLLGMSFLSKVRWTYERGELVLEQ